MPPPNRYRKIYKFSTPAGTPSSSGTGDTRVGNLFPLPDIAQHWGVFIYSPDDEYGYSDTFFELYRPNGGIGVLRRSRRDREQEEQHNSAIMRYTDTGQTTILDDESIEYCAQLVCELEMRNKYDLLNGNCQSMVNLLINRIAYGDEAFTPIQTSSHSIFGSGPVNYRSEYDRIAAVALPSTSEPSYIKVRTNSLNPDWSFAVEGQRYIWRPPNHRTPPASPPPPPPPPVENTSREGYIDLAISEYVPHEMTVTQFREQALEDARFRSGYTAFIDNGKQALRRASWEQRDDHEVDWSQWADPLDERLAERPRAEHSQSSDVDPPDGWSDNEEQNAHGVQPIYDDQLGIDDSDTEGQSDDANQDTYGVQPVYDDHLRSDDEPGVDYHFGSDNQDDSENQSESEQESENYDERASEDQYEDENQDTYGVQPMYEDHLGIDDEPGVDYHFRSDNQNDSENQSESEQESENYDERASEDQSDNEQQSEKETENFDEGSFTIEDQSEDENESEDEEESKSDGQSESENGYSNSDQSANGEEYASEDQYEFSDQDQDVD